MPSGHYLTNMKNFRLKLLSAFTVCALLMNACKPPESVPADPYFIFGHFYGECIGETCVEIFKVYGDKLWEDTDDRYPSDAYMQGTFTEIDQTHYNDALQLWADLPDDLRDETSTVLGYPDDLDQGGLFIQYLESNGDRAYFLIDQDTDDVPTYLHSWMGEVNALIAQLQ